MCSVFLLLINSITGRKRDREIGRENKKEKKKKKSERTAYTKEKARAPMVKACPRFQRHAFKKIAFRTLNFIRRNNTRTEDASCRVWREYSRALNCISRIIWDLRHWKKKERERAQKDSEKESKLRKTIVNKRKKRKRIAYYITRGMMNIPPR